MTGRQAVPAAYYGAILSLGLGLALRCLTVEEKKKATRRSRETTQYNHYTLGTYLVLHGFWFFLRERKKTANVFSASLPPFSPHHKIFSHVITHHTQQGSHILPQQLFSALYHLLLSLYLVYIHDTDIISPN